LLILCLSWYTICGPSSIGNRLLALVSSHKVSSSQQDDEEDERQWNQHDEYDPPGSESVVAITIRAVVVPFRVLKGGHCRCISS
jgi:hypothetical protein